LESNAKRARGAFEQVEMWRQLSAVSRRSLDAAVACAVAAQGARAAVHPEEEDAEIGASFTAEDAAQEQPPPAAAAKGAAGTDAGEPRTFKDWYLEKFTDAFSEDLDKIRVQELSGGKETNITSLIDAVVSGIDVIPELERSICLSHME